MGTRHNIGEVVVRLLLERTGGRTSKAPRRIKAETATVQLAGKPALLALPTVFMNESGQAVAPLLRYFSVPLERTLVIHDDIDLAFGKLRLQSGRGSAGHNGVASITEQVGSQQYHRLRIGVGRPPGRRDPADFVLDRFSPAERVELGVVVAEAADAVEQWVGST